jgi:hypothetical protein
MSDLILGPVVLNDFEVASGVNFGGTQALAVHDLPGGLRVIDALGRRDGPISFHGYFSGADAVPRARALDELRGQGLPLPLIWDAFFYTVLIRDFTADYQCGWWIPYRIVCTVLRDEAAVVIDAVADLAGDVLGDVGTALAGAAPAGVDLSPVSAAVSVSGSAVAGTGVYAAAYAAIGAGQASIASATASAEPALPQTALFGAGTAAAAIPAVAAAASTSGQLAALAAANAYLSRAAVNKANAST